MKNVVLFSALLLAIFGCGDKATPEKVAVDFATAMDKGDFKTAKTFGTESTNKMLDMVEPMINGMGELAKSGMGKGKFEKATCEGNDDKKTCKVCCDTDGKDKEFVLVKENGTWKVDMNKDDMKKDENAEEPEGESQDTSSTTTEPEPTHGDGGH